MGLEETVGAVVDPELGLSLGALGMVGAVDEKRRRVGVLLPGQGYPPASGEELRRLVIAAVAGTGGTRDVAVSFEVMDAAAQKAVAGVLTGARPSPGDGHGHDSGPSHSPTGSSLVAHLPSHTRVLAIASGKGGVGKSSVTVNLAISLAAQGNVVGILDADVYGFSCPAMLGVADPPMAIDSILVPPRAHGVRCLSMGYFVPADTPVIWRGPMLHKALAQFLTDAWWGDPDFLLVDMPPGTGDVTLTMAEYLPNAEVFVVTTPQHAAVEVAQRSAYAARKLRLSLRGVIENMSWFETEDGTRHDIFGRGGGEALAGTLGVPLVGQVPLVPALREGGDSGLPVTVSDPGSPAARAFAGLADKVASLKPARRRPSELKVRA